MYTAYMLSFRQETQCSSWSQLAENRHRRIAVDLYSTLKAELSLVLLSVEPPSWAYLAGWSTKFPKEPHFEFELARFRLSLSAESFSPFSARLQREVRRPRLGRNFGRENPSIIQNNVLSLPEIFT